MRSQEQCTQQAARETETPKQSNRRGTRGVSHRAVAIHRHMAHVDAVVWVLTETHEDVGADNPPLISHSGKHKGARRLLPPGSLFTPGLQSCETRLPQGYFQTSLMVLEVAPRCVAVAANCTLK